ncbi:MAG: phosphoenolpyruvate carboxykinase (ATP) [Candidatus Roizmanbacteria bacterium]|nr:phosphoenolpyruvate carboxykinase (ATP) [Candidatus Roizmanbacteria bacterium]MCR4313361.1 phosphoenolpyruvate carboxykinase (ATP) [Candidatus Roizmanbacteria bacterium]
MNSGKIYRNQPVDFLIKKALERKEVIQSKSGALVTYTGKYTGRSPNDKFIVDSPSVHDKINWGKINVPISKENYDKLYKKVMSFFDSEKELFVVDAQVGADKKHSINLRVYCQYAYQAIFATHLFRRLDVGANHDSPLQFKPDLTVYCAPSVVADPKTDGTNSEAFVIMNIVEKTIIIGATKYAGEIKKSVFSYMNYLLPNKGVFPMHCSANIDVEGKTTALFFGLSGTGKTTLSTDPERRLIGDDEHGWSENGVFNFEGGCYAKCINIKKESEPQIWSAIHQSGALVENVVLKGDGEFDFNDDKFTENTRAVYPLEFINNSVPTGTGGQPKYVIFLTADATGVLPPVARLNPDQAAYHFLSGYTSKLAGTERGIKEPQSTFSAYFGGPFMPQKPMVYLNLLKKYLKEYKTTTFLVNTGWTGGAYGVGKRISIHDTRNIITAILTGKLDNKEYRHDKIFNLFVPVSVPGVEEKVLNPSLSWSDENLYNDRAKNLARLFIENIKKYPDINQLIVDAGPVIPA